MTNELFIRTTVSQPPSIIRTRARRTTGYFTLHIESCSCILMTKVGKWTNVKIYFLKWSVVVVTAIDRHNKKIMVDKVLGNAETDHLAL